METTIAILGVGLIGGSIALCLRQDGRNRLIGYEVREETLQAAIERDVIHNGTTVLEEAVREADIIFLATPVEQIYRLLAELATLPLKEGVIITDVGSTKAGIVKYANERFGEQAVFIGGHPMAGSHKSGVEAANSLLFENAYYVLTPPPDADAKKVARLHQLLELTRAKIVVMNPDEHDRVVGAVSHFPHILAAVLVNQVARYDQENDWHRRLAAGGFRDITRIASSNPRMWRDILLNNREQLLHIAADWRAALDEIMELVEASEPQAIEHFFREARAFRDGLPERQKGALQPLYDLYIDIPDHPGEIGKITTLLGAKEINLTNIQIRETREDMLGVLRITFRNQREMEKGEELLSFFGYPVYHRD